MISDYPQRKNTRLKTSDYSQPGYYFITLCTRDRAPLLGSIVEGVVCLSALGKMVKEQTELLPGRYDRLLRDKYVIMPNHIHMILRIAERINPLHTGAAAKEKHIDIPNVIGKWKAGITRQSGGHSIWQETYYDRVIRSEAEYLRIWNYIDTNPVKWAEDVYFA